VFTERAAKMNQGLEKCCIKKKKKVKELNLFSLVKRTFTRVHKYHHGRKYWVRSCLIWQRKAETKLTA